MTLTSYIISNNIGGIMFYKLGLEAFNGSIVTLATDRFNAANAFEKLGVLQGLNQAFQVCTFLSIIPAGDHGC